MTGHQTPVISDESIALQWMTFDEALNSADASLQRFIEITYNLIK
jgi:hypothetical protein